VPAIRKITHKPAGKAMTIVEIEAAIADARAHGAHSDDVPKVRILFGGAIKELTIEIKTGEPTDTGAGR
jgi:hypothetical protein